MAMATLVIRQTAPSATTLDATLNAAIQRPVFVLFIGEVRSISAAIRRRAHPPHLFMQGTPSWCSDTVNALPAIEAAFKLERSRARSSRLVHTLRLLVLRLQNDAPAPTRLRQVPVVRDEYKGRPEYWARLHAAKLARVPSLMKWGAEGPIALLVESQCGDVALLEELVGAEEEDDE